MREEYTDRERRTIGVLLATMLALITMGVLGIIDLDDTKTNQSPTTQEVTP